MTSETVTRMFNASLFGYLVISRIVTYLFEPESTRKVPWETVYNWSPIVGMVGAIVLLVILLLWGAALAKGFWNRWVADVWKVRVISYDESLAIVLILAIFSKL